MTHFWLMVESHRNGSDTEYFKAEDLAIFIKRYLIDNNTTVVSLAFEAKISEFTIYRITGASAKGYVPFITADKIFTAMGVPLILNTLDKFARRNVYVNIEPPPSQYYEE